MPNDPFQDFITEKNKLEVQNIIRGKKRLRRPKIMLHPRAIENNYSVQLKDIVATGKKLYNESIKNNPSLAVILTIDQESNEIESLFDSLELNWKQNTPDVEAMALNIGQRTSEWNDTQWRRTMKGVLGVDIIAAEPWLPEVVNSFTLENSELIVTLQEDAIKDIKTMTQRAFRDGTRVETLRKDIINKWETTRNRAELIARDQVSKLNGQLTRRRQQAVGLDRYVWSTAGDQRVRPSHRAMEGRICDWNDPTIYYDAAGNKHSRSGIGGVMLHPGQDYQCRCVGLPYFDDLLEEAA